MHSASAWRGVLSLGTVKETARVRLNGKDLGVVWCAPWQVDITAAAKRGENLLEIEVVNLWPNRLIGDASLPKDQRRTITNVRRFERPGATLLESGLLGPVTLQFAPDVRNDARMFLVIISAATGGWLAGLVPEF